ncbi:Dimer-Tnp-hAT multi-domain protein [Pyrenophora tritici-repentis]|nr:Dimer-Tnp-hAT multi-domain protein [Pyrenophora tritici-repentis]
MGSDDRYDKEPKIPKLTKENHEKWFRNNKLKLKGKGIFYTIEVTKHAYAWIARHGAGTSTSTANTSQDPAGTVNPTEQASVLGLTSDFERLGGTWNAEKAKEYDKDEAKALFYITNSLLDDDDALADEYETASALWTALKVKYSKTDQLTANNIMTKLQNFTWKDEKDVDYMWAKLKEYRRKIIAAKPAAKGLYNDEALLQIMLRALPESYGSVIDYLDVQTSLTVDEKIAALRTKELRLNDTAEHANVAFPKYRHPNDHRSSDSSMRDRPRSTSPELGPSTGCLHCKGEHWARDCKYKGEIQEFGRKLREKDERAERRAAKSKRPSRNENKKRSDKPVKPTVKTTSRRKHGNRGNFINNFIEPAGLTENEEDEYEAWKRSEPIAGEGVDPIKYWVELRDRHPSLSKFAIDMLSIPGSSCECERLFSELGDLLEPRRRSISPQLLAAIQCDRRWIRAGFGSGEVPVKGVISDEEMDAKYGVHKWDIS